MIDLKGKVAVVFGLANKRSIAWGIAQKLSEAGATLAICYQNERLKKEADASLAIEALCILHAPVGVDQVGTSTDGYLFGAPAPPTTAATATSALNLAPSTEVSPQHKFLGLNTSEQACVQIATVTSTPAAERAVATLAAGR